MANRKIQLLLVALLVASVGGVYFYLRVKRTSVLPPPSAGDTLDAKRKQAMESYADANRAFAERDFEGAIADYSKALDLDSGLIAAYVARGNAHLALMRYDRAIAEYDLAIYQDPDYSSAYLARGTVNWLLGQLPEAEKDYKKTVLLEPGESLYYDRLATVLKEEKKTSEVEHLFENAYELDHDKTWALTRWLGEILQAERYADIVDICEKLRQDVPEDNSVSPTISLYGGIAHLRLKDYEAAIPELETVIRTDPDGLGFSAYEPLAEAYRATGEVKSCQENLAEYSRRMGRETRAGWCEERSSS